MPHSPCPTLVLHLWGHHALNLPLLLPTPYPVFLHNLFPSLFIHLCPLTTHSYHFSYTSSLSSHVPIKHPFSSLIIIIIVISQVKYGYNTEEEEETALTSPTNKLSSTSLFFPIQLLNKKPVFEALAIGVGKRWKAL